MTHIVMTEIGEGEDKIVLTNRLTDEQMELYTKLVKENPETSREELMEEVFNQIPYIE